MQALQQREREVEAGHAERIEDIKLKKTEEKNRLVAKIQRKKIKGIFYSRETEIYFNSFENINEGKGRGGRKSERTQKRHYRRIS